MNRNKVKQEVPIKDKETGAILGFKTIWHQKKFNSFQYQSYTLLWRQENMKARPNSKRQKLLRGESVEAVAEVSPQAPEVA